MKTGDLVYSPKHQVIGVVICGLHHAHLAGADGQDYAFDPTEELTPIADGTQVLAMMEEQICKN